MITISFLNGPRVGEVISLPEGEWTAGRAPDNAIVIPDPSVSARHAEVLVSYGEVIVRELGARNGTFVQGRKVESQHPVDSGQVVRFGAVELRVSVPVEDDPGGATSVTAAYALRQPEAPSTHPRPAPNTTSTVVADPTQVLGNLPPDRPAIHTTHRINGASPTSERTAPPGWVWTLGAVVLMVMLWLFLR